MIYTGMSGFSYPEWIGEIYPKGTKRTQMLEAYAEVFNAVEINMSFRRTPEEKTIDRWRDTVGPGFRFSMKANQRITHWRRLVDVDEPLREFLGRATRLGERLGVVLFQVHPNMRFDPDVLDAFGASLPSGTTYAFEPRGPSFNEPEASDILRRHGIALCLNDDIFDVKDYRTTGSIAYFRFHRDAYDADAIGERVAMVRAVASGVDDVYVFFAHEDNPDSVKPALAFRDALAS